MPPTETQAAMDQLLATLDLEKLEENLYRGSSPQAGWQRVFGGQVIAQALMAAQRTVEKNASSIRFMPNSFGPAIRRSRSVNRWSRSAEEPASNGMANLGTHG